jgi:SRSO17 transposase
VTGWMRAEAAGEAGPWRQQAILGRGRWEADIPRDFVREYAVESLADQDAVLVIDETGFLKQSLPRIKSQIGVPERVDHQYGITRHSPARARTLLHVASAASRCSNVPAATR